MLGDADSDDHYDPSTRVVAVARPAGGGSCGFSLTRSRWDPYPWVGGVEPGGAADLAGVRLGDCLLEVNGEDVIGRRVSEVAENVKSKPEQVSLLLWNAGVGVQCTPEMICCGPMPTNLQRLSACMSTILTYLECPVCLDTIPPPTYQCDNGHMICVRCRTKSERCPVCRVRLSRGRSLLADQIYHALVDAFDLKEQPEAARTVTMQRIFKVKKCKNVPDIRVTQSHTEKFLARLGGKASSAENLATAPGGGEFGAGLRAKSLSNAEISRTAAPPRPLLLTVAAAAATCARSASCHGSFESLTRRPDEGVPPPFHCPFAATCTALIKGVDLVDHHRTSHGGPLMHYFQPRLRVTLKKILKRNYLCYVVSFDGNTFYLKVEHDLAKSEDVLVWTWILADKRAAKEYETHVKIVDEAGKCILSVRNGVCSLSSTPYQEIREFRKAVFFNVNSLEILSASPKDFVFDISISRTDYE